ncbi:MAG: 4Fe-4S binding protein [Clostridia bacterium]|nr:4Fe-4S binding protein [Clostridia bacterium]
MENIKIFKFLQEQIHTTIIATNDEKGKPVTCAIDIMDYDENGLYFLTAKGKNFYKRLKSNGYLSLTGIKGENTMSCVAVSVHGNVREIGAERLQKLLDKNSYMYEIYPTEQSRSALTVFCLYQGSGDWFDLSKKPIERFCFSFGGNVGGENKYLITNKCIGCGKCLAVCPQNCIKLDKQATIQQKNCLHCGNCVSVCPVKAVIRK